MHVHPSLGALLNAGLKLGRDANGSWQHKSKHRFFSGELFLFTLTRRHPDIGAPTIWLLLWKRNHLNAFRALTCTMNKGNRGCVGSAGFSTPIMIGMEAAALMSLKLITVALSSCCSYLLSVRKASRLRPCVCRSQRNG